MPEALETAQPRAAISTRAVDLMQIPRLLGRALADLRAIADGMAPWPKLLLSLNQIRGRVETLHEDVSRVAHPLRRIGDRTRRREPGS